MAGSSYGVSYFGRGLYSAMPAIDLAGTLSASPGLAGAPNALYGLQGDLDPAVWTSGSLIETIALSGALPIRVELEGTLNNPVEFIGSLVAEITLASGDMPLNLVLAGDLRPIVLPGADVSLGVVLSGNLAPQMGLSNPPFTAGPIWSPDTLCPDPGWQEEELCNG